MRVSKHELTPAMVAEVLSSTPVLLRTLTSHLPATVHQWQPDTDVWSINEIVGHLTAADQVAFADRIQSMVTTDNPTLPPIDVDQIARERQDRERPLAQLLDELATARQEHVALLRALTAADLARKGTYGSHGIFFVADFVYEWAYHDHAHLQQILDLLRLSIWPHFSPTMQRALGQPAAVSG